MGISTESAATKAFTVSKSRAGGQSIRMNWYSARKRRQLLTQATFPVGDVHEFQVGAHQVSVGGDQTQAIETGLDHSGGEFHLPQ